MTQTTISRETLQARSEILSEIVAYLKKGIDGFDIDPPDDRYQEGYLAALLNMRDFLA